MRERYHEGAPREANHALDGALVVALSLPVVAVLEDGVVLQSREQMAALACAVDRLVHNAHRLELDGPSMRKTRRLWRFARPPGSPFHPAANVIGQKMGD